MIVAARNPWIGTGSRSTSSSRSCRLRSRLMSVISRVTSMRRSRTVNGRSRSSFMNTNGVKKSFQIATMRNSARVAMIGFESGMTMRNNTRKSPAPSI